jgi:hypothetical protein
MYQDPIAALLLWQLRRTDEDRRSQRHANAERRAARRTHRHVPANHHEEHVR